MLGILAVIVCAGCVFAKLGLVWALKRKQVLYELERQAFQLAKNEAQNHIQQLKQVVAEKKQLAARQGALEKNLARLEDIQRKFMDRAQEEEDKWAKQEELIKNRHNA
jgi:predicted nuclease with TOPRIM domain